jgi:PhzF family phenazine biosynthesis protein
MKLPINIVDAFTDVKFKGNPAAVCMLKERIHDSLMQSIAFEMNLAETAFLYREDNGSFHLRWFTPETEVDLCGHGTLASSHLIFQKGLCKKSETILFNTRSGELKSTIKGDKITMDFPQISYKKVNYPKKLETALGIKPTFVGMTKWNYICEVESEKALLSLKPDFNMLQTLPGWGTIVTAGAALKLRNEGYDFVSRFFAPEKGVSEDPVTGSAHCSLALYWMAKTGKTEFKAYQASERGGTVWMKVVDDRVLLTGTAVTVLSGEIEV